MKGRKKITGAVVLFLSIIGLFSSCTECTKTIYYTERVPIYASLETVRDSTNISQSPQAITRVDVIKHSNSVYALMEENRGVHLVDRRNPLAPARGGFIEIAQCKAIELNDSILYAVQASDMVVFDVSNMADIKLINRLRNVVPQPSVQNDSIAVDFIMVDKVRTVKTNNCGNNGPNRFGDIAFIEPEITKGDQCDLLFLDDKLFVGHADGLSVWSTTNPAAPAQRDIIEHTSFNQYNYLARNEELLFLGDASEFVVLDISNISPRIIQQQGFGNRCSRLFFENGKLMANNASSKKEASCSKAETMSFVDMPGINMDFRTRQDHLFLGLKYTAADNGKIAVSLGINGLKLFDIFTGTFSESSQEVGAIGHTSDACDLDGNLLLSWSPSTDLNLFRHDAQTKRINWIKKVE